MKRIPLEQIAHLHEGKREPMIHVPRPSWHDTFGEDFYRFEIGGLPEINRFSSVARDSQNRRIGVYDSLHQMLRDTYIPLSAPNIIRLKRAVDEHHNLNKEAITAFTEENIFVDRDGIYGEEGAKKLLIIHGGGALHPKRMQYGYDHGLLENGVMRYTDDEATDMLTGRLPSGDRFPLCSVEVLRSGQFDEPLGRYGVIMDFEEAASAKKKLSKEEFFEDSLVLARAGTKQYLSEYFDMRTVAGNPVNDTLINDHSYDSASIAQSGRYLRIDRDMGIYTTPVDEHASFVGMAKPE